MARSLTLDLKLNLADLNARVSEAGRKLQGLASTSMQNLRGALQPAVQSLTALKDKANEAQLALIAMSAAGGLGLRKIVQEAAGDETALRRLRATFGDLSDGAEQFADSLARVSRRQAGELQGVLVTLQNILVPLDLGRERAAQLSQQLTTLAVDLSARFGVSTEDAGQRIAAAMFGASKALRDFGINLKQDNIEEEARKLGFAFKGLGDLSEEQRALATLNVILRDSAKFQGAAAAEAQSFHEQTKALNASLGELASDLGKSIIGVLAPMAGALQSVVQGIRDTLAETPRLTAVVSLLGAGFLSLFTAITAGFAIWATFGSSIKATIDLMKGLATAVTTAFNTFAAQNSATLEAAIQMQHFGKAVAYVGAALAGWQLGRLIDNVLGLGDSLQKVVQGQASTFGDKIKAFATAGVIAAATFGVGLISLARDGKVVRDANAELSTSTQRLVSTFGAGSEELANYNRLLKAGIPPAQAAVLAANELNELRFLEAKGAKKTAEEEERLAQLRRRNVDALESERQEMERNRTEADRLQETKKRLAEAEKEFGETIAEIALENVRVRQGEAAASLAELEKSSNARLEMLRARADDEMRLVENLQERVNQIRVQGASTPQLEAELRQSEEELSKHTRNVEVIRNAMLQSTQNFNAATKRLQDQRLKELRDGANQEISEVQRETQAQVALYDKAISEIENRLNQLRQKREQGSASALNFIKQLEDEALRGRNARAADLQALNDQAEAQLRVATTEKQRNQILSLVEQKQQRIVNERSREKELLQQIAEIDKRAEETARQSGDANRVNEMLAERRKLLDQLSDEQANQVEIEKALLPTLRERLELAKQEGAAEAKGDINEIADLEDQRLKHQREITELKNAEFAAMQKINVTLADQEAALRRLIDAQTRLSEAAARNLGVSTPDATGTATGAAGATNIADAKSAATTAQQAAVQANGAAQQLALSTKSISDAFTMSLAPLREQFTGLQGFVQQIGQQAAQLVPAISESLAQVLEGQNLVRQSLDQFGNVIIEKFGDTANGFRAQKILIDGLSEQIRQIDIRGASGAGDLGAAGLL